MAEELLQPDPDPQLSLIAPATAPASAPPAAVRIALDGAEYDVPPPVAAYLQGQAAQQDRLRQLEDAQRLQQQRWAGIEQAVIGQPQGPPSLEQLWFSDPAQAAQILEDRAYQRFEHRLQAHESERAFWTTFEQEHTELAGKRDLVQYMLSTDPTLAQAPNTPENRARLAQATRSRVLAWMGEQRGTTPTVPPIETGSRRVQARPAAEPDIGPATLKEMQAARAERRRRSRLGLAS